MVIRIGRGKYRPLSTHGISNPRMYSFLGPAHSRMSPHFYSICCVLSFRWFEKQTCAHQTSTHHSNQEQSRTSFYLHISEQHEETCQHDAHRLTQRKSHRAAARVRRANVQFDINPLYVHVFLFQTWKRYSIFRILCGQ